MSRELVLDRLTPSESFDYLEGSWLGPLNHGDRVSSSSGTVHLLSGHTRLGLPTTRCGQYVDRAWDQIPVDDEAGCRTCVRLTELDERKAIAS